MDHRHLGHILVGVIASPECAIFIIMASAFLQSAAIVPPFMASPFIVSARTVVVPAASNPKAVATAKGPARNIRFIVVLSQSVGDRRSRSGPPACGHASGSRPVR